MIAYVLLRLAARAVKSKFDILRFTELVGSLLFSRRRLPTIETPPAVNPSKKQDRSNPGQMDFLYA